MGLLHYLICVLAVSVSYVASERCVYHHVFTNDTWVHCSTGCCYTYIHPCCDDYRVDVGRITGVVAGGVALFGFSIVFLVWLRYRRQQRLTQIARTCYPAYPQIQAPNGNMNYVSNYPVQPPPYAEAPPPYPGVGQANGVDNSANGVVKY